MDYIEYEINQYSRELELAEEMEKLGFDNIDDYYNYIEDEKADAEIARHEAILEY